MKLPAKTAKIYYKGRAAPTKKKKSQHTRHYKTGKTVIVNKGHGKVKPLAHRENRDLEYDKAVEQGYLSYHEGELLKKRYH